MASWPSSAWAPTVSRPAAVLALVIMAGALATHVRVKDEPKEFVPPVITTILALIVIATA